DDGRMLLHTILTYQWQQMPALGIKLTMRDVRFARFIGTEIFPGGWLPTPQTVGEYAVTAGFELTRVHSLQLHYARTLETWAANKDAAIAIQSQEVYDRYMKYLTGCAKLFRQGYTDVDQFTLQK
ncbi:class I SAM-dependent methyltransferase, partial [Mycobacterium sp. E3298]|uniref:class I SAM-dependent methyltransferase n=1 Tax=Mycobacterium sp. E3298 TaxID=1856865 RepID=UPI000B05FAC2